MKLLTRRHAATSPASGTRAEADPTEGTVPIATVAWREEVRVAGQIRSIRVQPWAGIPTLECTLVDPSGGLTVIFLGRRAVAGVVPGCRMVVEGRAGEHNGRLALLNPRYQLI